MLRLSDTVNMYKKDMIIIRVGGDYISGLKHCRKRKFTTFLHMTLIRKFYVVTVE